MNESNKHEESSSVEEFQIMNPSPHPKNQPQLQEDQVNQVNQQQQLYCGGLLNRNDHFVIKILKILFSIPLLPIVLIWRLLCWLCNTIINCCQNQVFNCLVYCYGKTEQCLGYLWNSFCWVCDKLYNCICFICRKLYQILKILGQCSKKVLDMYSIFAINIIFKFAHMRSLIQEFSSFITIPISLKILVPCYFFVFNYCFTPIKDGSIWLIVQCYYCTTYLIEKTAIFIYRFAILPFYTYIILNVFYILKFITINILYKTILVNLYNGIRWILTNFYQYIILNFYDYILVKLCYEIILTNLAKCVKFIFYNIIYLQVIVTICNCTRWVMINIVYKLILLNFYKVIKFIVVDILFRIISTILKFFYYDILVNVCRCSKWFLVDIIYEMVLVNLFLYIIKPMYNLVIKSCKFIFQNLYQYILYPLWSISKYLINGIGSIISATSKFIYYKILTPLGNLVTTVAQGIVDLLKKITSFIIQLSKDIWTALKNFGQRMMGRNE